mgnify:CR=1 FL=1
MKAYLEDFTIVKVIIDNKNYQTNQKFYINKTKELKVIEEKLLHYEDILHMYEKDKKIEKILEKIDSKKEVEEIRNIIG